MGDTKLSIGMIYTNFGIICFLIKLAELYENSNYCHLTTNTCVEEKNIQQKLLFYDVNRPEGFNLRRDVYMRLAIMLKKKQIKGLNDWHLVLPPWHDLYHWNDYDSTPKAWSKYFDYISFKTYAPVLELYEVFSTNTLVQLDRIYVLQSYPFEGGNFIEKWEINTEGKCLYDGDFWGYQNITFKEIECIKFQGKASKLLEVILAHPTDSLVMVAHGEVALHDDYGSKDYWDCRKSMKFNKELINVAIEYIDNKFGCRGKCLNYISIHWRRGDFLIGHGNDIPSVEGTVKQIAKNIKSYNSSINKVYIATDSQLDELNELINRLDKFEYDVYYFVPSNNEMIHFDDGQIAIIDQIICSYSAYFIGTHESTYTYRIQEEREILGHPSTTTFNRFCPDSGYCEKPSKWTIVH